MKSSIRITTLVENSVHQAGLQAEHGLAFWVQTGHRNILFDTGPGALVAKNASRLGVALAVADAVVLSHGHHDHSGGLATVADLTQHARLFLHPDAVAPKYARDPDGTSRANGMPAEARMAIDRWPQAVVPTRSMTEVAEGVWVTGEIPRHTPYEDAGGPFFRDAAGREPDPIRDDQALFFHTALGVVAVVGCAHAGVVNTLHHICRLTGQDRIHAVLGGFHLLTANVDRLQATVLALREMRVTLLAPGHCTGARATADLWHAFPDRCSVCAVGARFEFARS